MAQAVYNQTGSSSNLAAWQAQRAAASSSRAKDITSAALDPATDRFADQLAAAHAAPVGAPTPLAPAQKPTAQPVVAVEEESSNDVIVSYSSRRSGAAEKTRVAADEDFSFDDFVDFINPLHHIPLVGSLYRELTGDTIKPEVQVAGSLAMGAVTGSLLLSGAAGVASAVMESKTGQEPTVQLAQALFGSDTVGSPSEETVQTQSAAVPEPKSTDPIRLAQADGAEESGPPTTDNKVVRLADATPGSSTITSERLSPAATAERVAAANSGKQGIVTASVGGLRVGNTIYTSPMMRSAAKLPAQTPVAPKDQVKQQTETALASVNAEISTPSAPLKGETLGSLIHEQARAQQAGNPLPPELVQDMMLMALDKYKAAHALTPQATTVQ